MQFNTYYNKVKQVLIAVACFASAMFLVYRGNTFNSADYCLVIPVMCMGTALFLCATGLAVALRNNTEA